MVTRLGRLRRRHKKLNKNRPKDFVEAMVLTDLEYEIYALEVWKAKYGLAALGKSVLYATAKFFTAREATS